jgi:CHAT domain-containing protein
MYLNKKLIVISIGILATAAILFYFLFYNSNFPNIFSKEKTNNNSKDYPQLFSKIVNSGNSDLISSFIEEDQQKFKAETGRLITNYLEFKNKGDFLKAEESLALAKKAGIFIKIYLQDEYYISAIKYNSSLSSDEVALKLNANAMFREGYLDYVNENYSQAKNKLIAARKLYKEISDVINISKIDYNLGNIQFQSGEYYSSLETYESAIQLSRVIKDKGVEIKAILGQGLIYSSIGNYSKALKIFTIALNDLEDDPSGLLRRYILNNIANIHYLLGDYDTSSKVYHAVLRESIEAKDDHMEARSLQNIGLNLIMQKDFKEAQRYLLKFMKSKAKADSPSQYAEALNCLAFVNIKMENAKKALKYLKKSIAISKQIEKPLVIADCLNLLGEAYMRLGDYNKAYNHMQECLSVCENIDNPYLICRFYRSSALVLKNMNKLKEAERHFQKAIHLIEEKRGGIEEHYLKSSYLATIKDIYEDMIVFQMVDLNRPISALYYSEQSRARAFLDMLGGKIELIYSDKNIVENRKSQQHNAQLATNFRLREVVQISSLKASDDTKNKKPELVSPYIIVPYKINEIQRSLNINTKILEYEITKEKTIIWLITNKRIKSKIIEISSEELRELIIRYRKALALKNDFLKEYPDWPERIQATDSLALKIYNILFRPIKEYVNKGDLLYIIPDDELFYIPFGSLKNEHNKYLIEDFDFAYVPSASILNLCLQKERGEIKAQEDKVLLVGNPVLSDVILDDYPALNPLTDAQEEITSISHIFPHSNSFLGVEAREENILEKIEDFEIIHIASHSLVDERMPLYSWILLGSSNMNSSISLMENPDDGLLMLPEIFKLNLSKSKLVVLSCCDTGLGKLLKGEGIIGFSRAFMYAGTPSLVVSLWKVEDKSTSLLFQKFYANIKNKGHSKAEALKSAQLQFIKDEKYKEYRHPFFWSSFITIGDGR